VRALAVAFLLSGAAGLVHELVWTRLLGLLFGVTEMAVATVLAAFMGGLAIGSWLVARTRLGAADGRRVYAGLEIGIGLAALSIPVVLHLVEPLYGMLWRRFHLSFATFSVLRLFTAGTILLGPTILMGATFPILAAHLRVLDPGRAPPPWLYTLNLVGAAVGVAAAGFVLLPAIGIRATIVVAALLNIGVGLWVLRMAAPPLPAPERAAPVAGPIAGPGRLLLIAAFLSGLASLAAQVAWTRVLTLLVGSTTYALTAVLLVYLTALALGSAWTTWRAARASDVRSDLAAMYALAGVLTVVAIAIVDDLPYFYLGLYDVWGAGAPGGSVARALATAVVLLLPSVAVAGTLLPLALVALLPSGRDGTAAAVGRVYALNTLGAIAGAVLAGFVLIPATGTQRTLAAIALLTAAMSVVLALTSSRRAWLVPAAVAALAVVVLGVGASGPWDYHALNVGVFEPGREAAAALRDPTVRVVYQREGPTASVVVLRWDDPDPTQVISGLLINGRANASDAPADLGTQVILAQLPLLLAPRIDRVLVVGWGSGVTVGSAAQTAAGRIDALELEPAVVEASRVFAHVNHEPLDDPRVRLHLDDARHVLLASTDVHDVVVSEPSHPWLAGVANLFTQDFYRLAARRLEEDGVFAQWLQTYQISWEAYRSLVATFQSVFPEVLVFRSPSPDSADSILIGSRRPLRLDLVELERRWRDARVRADLARVGLVRPEHVLALLYLGSDDVRSLVRGARLNTDDNMYVEFRGARDMAVEAEEHIFRRLESLASRIEDQLADRAALADPDRAAALVAGLERAGRPAELARAPSAE
jgi:spermidine synthase